MSNHGLYPIYLKVEHLQQELPEEEEEEETQRTPPQEYGKEKS